MRLWKAGVVVAVVALAAWCVVAVIVLTAKPHGANIGFGLIAEAALALSVVAESFLIAAAGQRSWKTVGVVGICAWGVWLACSSGDLLSLAGWLVLGLLPLGLLVASMTLLYRGGKDQAVTRR